MLVLTRRENETVVATLPDGSKMYVTVAEVRGDKVRLGFIADRGVAIHRQEVQERIETQAAA